MKDTLRLLFEGKTLSREQASGAMNHVISGEASSEQVAAFLGALRARRETPEEITGFAVAIRERAVRLPASMGSLIDTCGTGGDEAGTYNISTASAFILAGAGVGVAKHGNRSVSSRCGSADVLEALGVRIEQDPAQFERSVTKSGFGFLFAPFYHPALKNAGGVRKALGVRTVFNFLGPLCNPALVKRQVIGVSDASLLETMARVLQHLGSEEVIVARGECGLDELSLSDATRVAHLKNGRIETYLIKPEDAGLARARREELKGGSAEENAALITSLLKGELKGPKLDVLLLNASAAFVVAGRAASLREGVELSRSTIASGRAFKALENARAAR